MLSYERPAIGDNGVFLRASNIASNMLHRDTLRNKSVIASIGSRAYLPSKSIRKSCVVVPIDIPSRCANVYAKVDGCHDHTFR